MKPLKRNRDGSSYRIYHGISFVSAQKDSENDCDVWKYKYMTHELTQYHFCDIIL